MRLIWYIRSLGSAAVLGVILGVMPRPGLAQVGDTVQTDHLALPADTGGVNEAYISGGLTSPTSPASFANFWNTGVHVNGGIGLRRGDMFTIRFGFRYSGLGVERLALQASTPTITDSTTIPGHYYIVGPSMDLLADTPRLKNWGTPYVIMGLNIYFSNIPDAGGERGLQAVDMNGGGKLAVGLNAGVGFRRTVYRDLAIFGEMLFSAGFTGRETEAYAMFSSGLSVPL